MFDNEDKKQVFGIKMTIEAAKKLHSYLDEEFMENYEEFLATVEGSVKGDNEDFQYYEDIREILEDFVYELQKEIKKKERSSFSSTGKEEDECHEIKKKLDNYSQEILKKMMAVDRSIIAINLYRLYWHLHSLYNKSGEIVFTQNSLENLLGLDRHKLEKFLDKLSKIEVTIGNKKGKLITGYEFLNSMTVKINYNLYIVSPHVAAFKDKKFKIENLEKIKAIIK
ncbi:MAG: hypothetical protein ACRCSK_01350 [Fusobacteriaceae bacterium]